MVHSYDPKTSVTLEPLTIQVLPGRPDDSFRVSVADFNGLKGEVARLDAETVRQSDHAEANNALNKRIDQQGSLITANSDGISWLRSCLSDFVTTKAFEQDRCEKAATFQLCHERIEALEKRCAELDLMHERLQASLKRCWTYIDYCKLIESNRIWFILQICGINTVEDLAKCKVKDTYSQIVDTAKQHNCEAAVPTEDDFNAWTGWAGEYSELTKKSKSTGKPQAK